MKNIIVLLLIIYFAFPDPVEAVTIRSGEHGSFTRITAQIGRSTAWSIRQNDRNIEVWIDLKSGQLDFGNAFDRIDRLRVREIFSTTPRNNFTIVLNCDCGYMSLLDNNGLLIIDISEELSGPDTYQANTLNNSSLRHGLNNSIPLLVEKQPQNSFLLFNQASIVTSGGHHGQTLNITDTFAPTTLNNVNTSKAVNPGLQGLGQIIRDKVESGVLAESGPLGDVGNESGPNETILGLKVSAGLSSRNATSSISLIGAAQNECPNLYSININSWGHPDGFSRGKSYFFSRLNEDGNPKDPEVITALAKHYLHYGFGAKALSLLADNREVLSRETVLTLSMIAHIIEDIYVVPEPMETTNSSCSGFSIFWHLLSDYDKERHFDIDTDALQLLFESLPVHLKSLFGPKLAVTLADLGYHNAARDILNSSRREGSLKEEEIDVASLVVEMEDPSKVDLPRLFRLIEEDITEANANILSKVIEKMVQNSIPFLGSEPDTVRSYLYEFKDAALESELLGMYINTLTYSGNYLEAFDKLMSDSSLLDTDQYQNLLNTIIRESVSKSTDSVFLSLVARIPGELGDNELENIVAQRLLKIGLPDLAIPFVNETELPELGSERKILRARLFIALNELPQADAELRKITGELSEDLQVIIQGLKDEISQITNSSNSFSSGNVSDVMVSDSNSISGIDDTLITEPNTGDPRTQLESPNIENAVLGEAEQLIYSSQATRSEMREILSQPLSFD